MGGRKGAIAFFTIVSFVFFIVSCSTIHSIRKTPDQIKHEKNDPVTVKTVRKINGEIFYFSDNFPGILKGNQITGIPDISKLKKVIPSLVQRSVTENGMIQWMEMKDGTRIENVIFLMDQHDDLYYLEKKDQNIMVTIPLEEVEMMWVMKKTSNPALTFGTIVFIPVLISMFIKLNPFQSD